MSVTRRPEIASKLRINYAYHRSNIVDLPMLGELARELIINNVAVWQLVDGSRCTSEAWEVDFNYKSGAFIYKDNVLANDAQEVLAAVDDLKEFCSRTNIELWLSEFYAHLKERHPGICAVQSALLQYDFLYIVGVKHCCLQAAFLYNWREN